MAPQGAFEYCAELANATLGDSLTAIGEVRLVHTLPVMYLAANLAAVATCLVAGPFCPRVPDGAPLTCRWPVPCAQYAFQKSGLTEIVVPDSVVEIGLVCTTPAQHCHHRASICLRACLQGCADFPPPRVCGVTVRIR